MCGRKYSCHITNLCKNCPYSLYRKYPKECSYSKKCSCSQLCSLFTPLPQCNRLRKFPYTCQGCSKSIGCYLNKYLYDPIAAWKVITTERSASRKGTHTDEKEFDRLSKLLISLVNDNHQSLL